MKMNQKKIVLISFVGMILCYLTAYALNDEREDYYEHKKVKIHKGFDGETVHKVFTNLSNVTLDVSGPMIDVNVNQSENNDVSISVKKKSPDCDLDINNNSGNIVLTYGKQDGWSFLEWRKSEDNCVAEVTISAPKNSMLSIKTVSGNFVANGSYQDLRVTTVSGDIEVNTESPAAILHSVSGDIRLNGVVKKLDVKEVSGDATLTYDTLPAGGSLKTKTVSGDIKVNLPKNSQLSYKFKSVSGEFKVKDVAITESAGFFINSKSVSGGVSVN